MWVNGLRTTVNASRSNNVTTVVNTGGPFLLLPGTNNTVTIVCTDNASPSHSYTNSWQFSVMPVLAGQTAPSYYQSPGTLTVCCQLQYPLDKTMYFLDWEPILPLGWTLISAAGEGNPQVSGNEIIFDGPFSDPLTFSYTVSIPMNQTGSQGITAQALYFLSGMTNTAFAPVAPDPLAVNCTNLYVYNNTNCAVCAPSGLVAWWPAEYNAYDVAGTNNGTLQSGVTFVPGEVGYAFCLDGDGGCIDFGNQVGNFGTNDFTIDFWMKTTSAANAVVLSKRNSYGDGSFWDITIVSGYLYVEWDQDSSHSNYMNLEASRQSNERWFVSSCGGFAAE